MMRTNKQWVGWMGFAFLFAVAASSANAAVIYDDFTGTAGSTPNAALWTLTNNDGASSSLLDGNGAVYQAGVGAGTELLSTAVFSSGRFGFQFAGTASSSARGYGIAFDPYTGATGSRILLRTDFTGGLQLEVYDGVSQTQEYLSPVWLPFGTNDLWEIDYAPGTLAVYQNGTAIYGPTSISITGTIAKISMFAYGGGAQSFDFVSIPEPGSFALLSLGLGSILWFRRRR